MVFFALFVHLMNFESLQAIDLKLHDYLLVHHNPPSWNWRSTLPNYFNLWISLSGVGTITIDSKEFSFTRGSGILIKPGQHVWAEKSTKGEMVNLALHFTTSSPSKLYPFSNRMVHLRHLGLIYEIAQFLYTNAKNFPPSEENRWVAQMLHLFIIDSKKSPEDPRDRVIRQQIQSIRQKPYEIISVDLLAQEANLSPTQYRRRFKKLANSQPNAFIIDKRIQAAKRLLLESTLNIDEIASALGFRDTPFFSRQFKQKAGKSPSQFRRSLLD